MNILFLAANAAADSNGYSRLKKYVLLVASQAHACTP